MKIWNTNPDVTLEMTAKEYKKWIDSLASSDADRMAFILGYGESEENLVLIVVWGKLVQIKVMEES